MTWWSWLIILAIGATVVFGKYDSGRTDSV